MDGGGLPRTNEADLELTRHADVVAALLNADLVPDISAGEDFVGRNPDITLFLSLSGAEHTRRRASVSRALSVSSVQRLEAWLRDEAERQARSLECGQLVTLGDCFARPFSAAAIAKLLGLAPKNVAGVVPYARQVLDATRSPQRRSLAGYRVFRLASDSLERAKAGELAPGLICMLVETEADSSDILGIVMPLLVGGIELTARALMATLAKVLSKADGSDLSDTAIDTAIADFEIIPGAPRVAQRPTRVNEHAIREGDRIAVMLDAETAGAADRPLPFGLGAHYCIGAPWTRLVVRSGVSALCEAYPRIRVEEMKSAVGAPGGPLEIKASLER